MDLNSKDPPSIIIIQNKFFVDSYTKYFYAFRQQFNSKKKSFSFLWAQVGASFSGRTSQSVQL